MPEVYGANQAAQWEAQSEACSGWRYCRRMVRHHTRTAPWVPHPPVYVRSSTLIAQFQTLDVRLSAV